MDPARLERARQLSRRYVDEGKVPFSQLLVAHRGHIELQDSHGWANIERRAPIADDSIVRIYSMSKPIACAAALICYEMGHFELEQPVELFLPEFKDMQVFDAESGDLAPAARRMNIKQLFMHTSGLGGGVGGPHRAAYRDLVKAAAAGNEGEPDDLAESVRRMAALPLISHPGDRWNYAGGHTALGRLVEVWTGIPFGDFLQEHVFDPLGMTDTGFRLPEDKFSRLASNYQVPNLRGSFQQVAEAGHYSTGDGEVAELVDISGRTSAAVSDPERAHRLASGSGGLVGTIGDYFKFAQCLLDNMKGRSSGPNGVRLLGRKTAELMATNHAKADGSQQVVWGARGLGFGLGVAVDIEPTESTGFTSAGEFWWGGAASTLCKIAALSGFVAPPVLPTLKSIAVAVWVDPAEEVVCIYHTQLMPSDFWPMRTQLRIAVNSALIDAPPPQHAPSTAGVGARL